MVPFLMVAVAPDKTLAGAAVAGSGEGAGGGATMAIIRFRAVITGANGRTIHEARSLYRVQ